jgi:hypothetical protein
MILETKVVLLFGSVLPPLKHIEKILWQFSRHYFRDQLKEDFNEDNYYDVRVEQQYTGMEPREFNYSFGVYVKKEFSPKFIAIFKALKGNAFLCKDKHEHPTAYISGIKFEGYCYYFDDVDEKIIFLTEYRDEKDEYFSIKQWDAYAKLSPNKRWITVEATKDTDEVLKEWILNILQTAEGV